MAEESVALAMMTAAPAAKEAARRLAEDGVIVSWQAIRDALQMARLCASAAAAVCARELAADSLAALPDARSTST